jgi:hypothetical protein
MKKLTPVKAIRQKCLECSSFQPSEVRKCDIAECPLYLYRLGKRPKSTDRQFLQKIPS